MKFDAYEYVGVIVPGCIPIVTIVALYPSAIPIVEATLSIGDFGIILILAFIAGHLLQAFGNLWESIVWFFLGGMPTSWAAKQNTSLLTDAQLKRLGEALERDFGCDRSALSSGRGLLREIVIRVGQRGSVDRIEKFNRNYGLMRGIACGFLAAGLLTLTIDLENWRQASGLLVLAGIATYRMVRFGTHYARETLAEYLNLAKT